MFHFITLKGLLFPLLGKREGLRIFRELFKTYDDDNN